ncbi:MAG: RHS repeat protein [Muribaculaceae bacterium]|nr:RHS repeat protein [Muribaculaceae bacterium]
MQKTIIITIFLMLALSVSSQMQIPPKNVLSPNASSLGEYGVIPVLPYTGLQNISIPIHEIEVGEHKIPITLNYHSGGVRIEQLPGWVGMSWSLNAGGCISRVVNDNTDEFYTKNRGYQGYFYHSSLFNHKQSASASQNNEWYENVKNKIAAAIDVTPDKFQFNFLNYSGVFYWTPENEWKVLCDKPIKVEFDFENGYTEIYSKTSEKFSIEGTNSNVARSHQIRTFTLIGEDGTKYVFGDNEDAIEVSVNLFEQRTRPIVASTWHLTKIIYPDTREVSFSYEHGDFIAQLYLNDCFEYVRYESNEEPLHVSIDNYNGELVLPSYLKEITTDYTTIQFTKDTCNYKFKDNIRQICDRYAGISYNNPDWSSFMPILTHNGVYDSMPRDYPRCLDALRLTKLKSIDVYNYINYAGYENKIKSIKFEYTDTSSQRLTLDSVIIGINEDQSSQAIYRFEYNQPELLPEYLSNKTDHWGFGNSIISPRVNQECYESTREPDITVSQYGMLTKITYPTGGYNRFEYEPHDYAQKVTESRTGVVQLDTKRYAGGVRIKKIINSPSGLASDEYVDKEYFYVTDFIANGIDSNQSSGILTQLYRYSQIGQEIPDCRTFGEVIIDSYSSQSYLPSIGNISNNHIEYSEVVERYNDNSFTIYQYTNFSDGHHDLPNIFTASNQLSIYEPTNARDQERGLLKSAKEYNYTKQLQKSISFQYERSGNLENSYVPIYKFRYGAIGNKVWLRGSLYYAYTYTMRPKTQIETIYEGVDSLRKETSYTYNNIGLVETITTTQSDSNKQRVTLKYPNSYSGTYYEQMVQNNRISPIVEKVIETINGYTYTTEFKQNNKYENNSVKPSSTYYAYGNDAYCLVASYKYDQYYNLVESNPINAPITSYLWGYKGLYPVAEIKDLSHNVVSEKLNNSNFTMTDTPDTTALSNLRASLTTGTMTTYYYNAFGKISKIINPNGRCTTYHYDILGRLVAIKDEDGNYIEVYNYNYAH